MKYVATCLLLICLLPIPACKKRQPVTAGPGVSQGSVESEAQPSHAKPEVQISATPSSIERGETSTLEWSTAGASSVVIDNGVGNVGGSGSITVTPRESTTFTASASGPGGEARASVRVTITEGASSGLGSTDIAGLLEALSSGKIRPVFFAYDQAELSQEARSVLEENAGWFRRFPGAGVVVEGHCDERGTEEYNLALGDRRAQAAYHYLVQLGVSAEQLETTSLGEERPFESGHTESAYSSNRRAHFAPRQR